MDALTLSAGPKSESQSIGSVLEEAFGRLSRMQTHENFARLFPNRIQSTEVQVSLGTEEKPGLWISLSVKGLPQTEEAIAYEPLDVLLDGDVEALFNSEGHHVVALIAQSTMERSFPQTLRKVRRILEKGGRSLLAAATYPDDIRAAQPKTKPFHYVDIPFEDGGPENPPLPDAPHVISKITDFSRALRQRTGSVEDQVNALSWLIHLFGDIHQPLHCIEHISALHPRGDRGGNSFLLRGKSKNLHSLWDSSVSFTHEDEQKIAQGIIKEYSQADLAADLKLSEPETWARASFKLAKKLAYGPLLENPASPPLPSAEYLRNAEKVGRRQAALAGYRLANRLHELLV
jgi:hypothetical protein